MERKQYHKEIIINLNEIFFSFSFKFHLFGWILFYSFYIFLHFLICYVNIVRSSEQVDFFLLFSDQTFPNTFHTLTVNGKWKKKIKCFIWKISCHKYLRRIQFFFLLFQIDFSWKLCNQTKCGKTSISTLHLFFFYSAFHEYIVESKYLQKEMCYYYWSDVV